MNKIDDFDYTEMDRFFNEDYQGSGFKDYIQEERDIEIRYFEHGAHFRYDSLFRKLLELQRSADGCSDEAQNPASRNAPRFNVK